MPDPASEACTSPPWPASPFVLDLDAIAPTVTADDLLALERRSTPVIGMVRGRCEGPAMAAAASVQLLVAGEAARFRVRGPGSDLALRRLVGVVGRRVTTYLAVATVPADLAWRWGLVTHLAEDPLATALEARAGVVRRSSTAVEVVMRELARDAPAQHAYSRVTSRALDLRTRGG